VFTHVIAGRQNKQIAKMLGISLKTAKVHRGHMMAKMGVASVAEPVRMTSRISVQPHRAINDLNSRDAGIRILSKATVARA
jgi:hypothetical protein